MPDGFKKRLIQAIVIHTKMEAGNANSRIMREKVQ